MKKFLTLLAFSALAAVGLQAQIDDAPVLIGNNDYSMHLLTKQIVNNSQYVFYSNNTDKEYYGGKYIIYNKNLEVVKELDIPDVSYINYCDYDGVFDVRFLVSQSLFNSDDNFEFIVPVISQVGVNSYDNEPRMGITGFMLQNEKEETLQTVNFPNKLFSNFYSYDCHLHDCELMDLGDIKYLKISGLEKALGNDEYEYYDLMYRLNDGGSRVLSLACPPMRVHARPTVAGASEPVTVSFDSDNVSRIEVVSVKGSIAGTYKVAPGEHSATIDTSRLGKGMYIINVVENGTRSENCKIIIR